MFNLKSVKKPKVKFKSFLLTTTILILFTISSCFNANSSSSNTTLTASSTSVSSSTNLVASDQVKLVAVEVDKLPSRINYLSTEVISTSGGVLRVVYSDYRVRYVSMNDAMIEVSRLNTSSVGTSRVTLRYEELGTTLFTSYQINIIPFKVALQKVELDIISSDVAFEQKVNLNYIIYPLNAYYQQVEWSSSNELIARVDSNGVVTPINQGEVLISVKVDNNFTATSKLNILPMQPREIQLNPTFVSLIEQGWIPLSSAADLAAIDDPLTSTSRIFAANTSYAVTVENKTSAQMLDLNYFLVNNIDLSSIANWTPLETFTGELNGLNHSINNLVINRSTSNTGFFSIIDGAVIKNLRFTNAKINFNQEVQGLIGIENAGILVGRINGTNLRDNLISNITVDSSSYIKFSRNFSGIIGFITSGSTPKTIINDSTNEAIVISVFADNNRINSGGIVGLVLDSNVEINNSKNYGSLTIPRTTSLGTRLGGIVGSFTGNQINTSFINNSFNYGAIEGNYRVGGLVGNLEKATIRNSENYGSISANGDVGGIVGYAVRGLIEKVYNSGSVTGYVINVGGIVGNHDASTLGQSFNSGTIVGFQNLGGLVGLLTVDSSAVDPASSIVNNSYNLGSVTSTYINNDSSQTANAGGIIGRTSRSTKTVQLVIENNYNVGTITKTANSSTTIGGIVGIAIALAGATGSLVYTRNYFLNTSVANEKAFGNLTANNDDNRKLINANEIKLKSTFVNWSFETGNPPVWGIDSNINNGSPYLLWQQNN